MCEFHKILDLPENYEFKNYIMPKLKFWERLVPRDCIFGGWREIYCRKWTKLENQGEKLLFLVSYPLSISYPLK